MRAAWPHVSMPPKCACVMVIPDPVCDCYRDGGSDRADKCRNPTSAKYDCSCCGRRVPLCYGNRAARMCEDCKP